MELQVAFPSDGEQIFGVLHVPERTPSAGLIMCHGFTGHKAETHRLFVRTARDFCAHGFTVLRFDFRGSGDSAGEFRDMTIAREIEDAQVALSFLATRSEVDANRLGVLGLSLGGCVSACLAGLDPRIKALVLWSAVAHPGRIFDRRHPNLGDAEWIDMEGWGLGRAFIEGARDIHPLELLQNYRGPSFVVHGINDQSVPASDAADYKQTLGDHCTLHYIDQADHTFSSFPWMENAIGHSRQFFLQSLGVS